MARQKQQESISCHLTKSDPHGDYGGEHNRSSVVVGIVKTHHRGNVYFC